MSLPELRKAFIISAIKHLRRYNFDGLDLDWEYPASRDGSAPEDRENYALLVTVSTISCLCWGKGRDFDLALWWSGKAAETEIEGRE